MQSMLGPHNQFDNVIASLEARARSDPQGIALFIPEKSVRHHGTTPHRLVTYRELYDETTAICAGLKAIGVNRGERVVMMIPPSLAFFTWTFALLRYGTVPVLIDPGMGIKNLGKCLEEAAPQIFLGIGKAHWARRFLGWGKNTIRRTIKVGRTSWWSHHTTEQIRAKGRAASFVDPNLQRSDPAAILFTSGSTGIAKGAEYTHGIFAAQVRLIQQEFSIQPGEIDLCTFPLFALFGPALGMTCVIPDMNASRPATLDPRKARAQIQQFQVTNMFASPAVLRRLLELEEGQGLQSLKRVISAGAPATLEVIEQFQTRFLPQGEIFTPYGATEALPVAKISSHELLKTKKATEEGAGICVGRPVKEMEVRIISLSDEPIKDWSEACELPVGQIGELVVKGPVVTQRYFGRDEATRLAKIKPLEGDQVWHRMGDLGYFDSAGNIWFCGRKAHRVETLTGTLYTDQIEPIFNTVPGVFRTALVGVTDQTGQKFPVLCVERIQANNTPKQLFRAHADSWDHILTKLQQLARDKQLAESITLFLDHPGFPVDVRHNSKIFREKLALWASETLQQNPSLWGDRR